MPKHILKLKDKISKKQSSEKIHAFAKFSNHGLSFRPKTGDELEIWFRNRGVDTTKLVEECRVPSKQVPEFENLIDSTWVVTGGEASHVDPDGEVVSSVNGPGALVMSNCMAHFEAACLARDRAISESSAFAFYESLSQGISSVEALLNDCARVWNKQGNTPYLEDSFENKVSLETKLGEWIPLISGGLEVDKSNRNWSNFKELRKIRDNEAMHPSLPSRGISYKKLAININKFRYGIAFFLGNLHVTLGRRVPAVIINAIYFPDVELVLSDE